MRLAKAKNYTGVAGQQNEQILQHGHSALT